MLPSVLKSDRAIDVTVAIMRIFVQMRQIFISNKDFEIKLKDLEAMYEQHDGQLTVIFDALGKLMAIRSIPRSVSNSKIT